MYFGSVDMHKFKDGAEPYHVFKMLRWMADGYLHDVQMSGKPVILEEMMAEFGVWIEMMRKLTYKEEYQDECD